MKPNLLFFALTILPLCAWQSASAQPPAVYPAWEPNPGAWPAAPSQAALPEPTQAFASPGAMLPYGYLWQDYRGASAEHDILGQRAAWQSHHAAAPRGILASLHCWLDSFLVVHHAPPKRSCCEACGAPMVAPAPSLMTESIPEFQPKTLLEPAVPVPAPDIPLAEEPLQHEPNRFVPIKEVEVPSIIAVPDELNRARPPVVELAPDVVLQPEPANPVPPRNRIPTPGSPPPRNTIPSR